MSASRVLAVVAGLGLWADSASARPQERPVSSAQTATSTSSRGLVAPELLEFVEAPFPEVALAEGREGQVVLKLTLDTEGRVTDAQVLLGAGYGFDQAALEAALQFRFSPALKDGTPVLARIPYTYTFSLPPPSPAGSVVGRVTMPEGEAPAVGAQVTLTEAEGRAYAARTSTAGVFRLEELPPGLYELQVQAPGIGASELPVSVSTGQTSKPTVRLLPDPAQSSIDVTVHGQSEAERLRRSAQAVTVLELSEERKQTVDLGEVLARSEGVGVRRTAGLGSGVSFSLNGLSDDQIRFFLDGVPLEYSGFALGIGNVPVNLINRIEVFRGVVPIALGADALGGAVNLVTDDDLDGTHAAVSYQAGSFGTQRGTVTARHLDEGSGLFVRGTAFADIADNDYLVDVEVSDRRTETRGQPVDIEARRFHDEYQALGGSFEIGFANRPWAERLVARGYLTSTFRELQSDFNMLQPWGEVTQNRLQVGASVRFVDASKDGRLRTDAVILFQQGSQDFLDVATCIYNWLGECVRERNRPGEINPGTPRDDTLDEQVALARITTSWTPLRNHTFSLSVAPTWVARSGTDRLRPDAVISADVTDDRDLVTVVSGLSHTFRGLESRFESIAFLKSYMQYQRSQARNAGSLGDPTELDRIRFGGGNSLRYAFAPWLYIKASYEFATRLPNVEEVFGDGGLTNPSLDLRAEKSHNVNLGVNLDLKTVASGSWRGRLNGFLRETRDQIVLLPAFGLVFQSSNLLDARLAGVEGSAGWTSPGGILSLDANSTYLDYRNLSDEGDFAPFENDRVPNRPFFFVNGMIRLAWPKPLFAGDLLSLTSNFRYVSEFFEFWESAGTEESKRTIDEQFQVSLGLTYEASVGDKQLTFTGEMLNLTDAALFDFFGAQRPGRSVFFKVTGRI